MQVRGNARWEEPYVILEHIAVGTQGIQCIPKEQEMSPPPAKYVLGHKKTASFAWKCLFWLLVYLTKQQQQKNSFSE